MEDGHIYVARPPLYKVMQKKHVRFVQTVEEMDAELIERGLKDTKLTVLPPPAEGATPPAPACCKATELARADAGAEPNWRKRWNPGAARL